MLTLCSSIMKKSRWCFGLGTRVEDKTERCEPYRRSLTQNLSPQLESGSKRVCPVLDEKELEMATYQLNVNGQRKEVNVDPSTPLLWVLREELKMTGTKYGCGISVCGACTVHLDGVATRSCVVPISLVGNRRIVTIEGIGSDPVGRVVQEAWVEKDVVQCGYCQSGQIMSACALLKANPKPTDANIEESMGGNLCRCAAYVRIRQAIRDASQRLG
jgi:isoquinoline 1-oxidoreductase subunit alpha